MSVFVYLLIATCPSVQGVILPIVAMDMQVVAFKIDVVGTNKDPVRYTSRRCEESTKKWDIGCRLLE
jgi:hypothetical protein